MEITCPVCFNHIDLCSNPSRVCLQMCCLNFYHNKCILPWYAQGNNTCPSCQQDRRAPKRRNQIKFEKLVSTILQWMFPEKAIPFEQVYEWVKKQPPSELNKLIASKFNPSILQPTPFFTAEMRKKKDSCFRHARAVQRQLFATLSMANASPNKLNLINVRAIELGELEAQLTRVARQLRVQETKNLSDLKVALTEGWHFVMSVPNGGFEEWEENLLYSMLMLFTLVMLEIVFAAVREELKAPADSVHKMIAVSLRIIEHTTSLVLRCLFELFCFGQNGPAARYANTGYYNIFKVIFYASAFWIYFV